MPQEIQELLLRKHDEMAQEVVNVRTSLASVHTTLVHISDTLLEIKKDNLTTRSEVDTLKADNNKMKGVLGFISFTGIVYIINFFKTLHL
jgi:hypothetical protein